MHCNPGGPVRPMMTSLLESGMASSTICSSASQRVYIYGPHQSLWMGSAQWKFAKCQHLWLFSCWRRQCWLSRQTQTSDQQTNIQI